jgi:hypothetical protein
VSERPAVPLILLIGEPVGNLIMMVMLMMAMVVMMPGQRCSGA